MTSFEWDEQKNKTNQSKHGVAFEDAQRAFLDSDRVIARDIDPSKEGEQRFFCFGKVDGGIMTVRFTLRSDKIRILGAGYWRRGKREYEKENKVH